MFVFRLVLHQVSLESWYAKIDSLVETPTNIAGSHGDRFTRPFVTLVANDNKELIKVSFDAGQFSRRRRTKVK